MGQQLSKNKIHHLTDLRTFRTGFWSLPKPFYIIFLVELWERFAYYGVQSIAVIYFVKRLGMSDALSSELFASFSGLLYALLIVGGAIGDKVLGLGRTYLLGIIFLIVGYAGLGLMHNTNQLYLAMATIIVGNALFKTNATNYVSRCFESNDPRLDSVFTYFYMAINIGSFLGLSIVPLVQSYFGYHLAFAVCALAMIIGLIFYLVFRKTLYLVDNQVGKATQGVKWKIISVIVGSILIIIPLSYLLRSLSITNIVFYIGIAIVVFIYFMIARKLDHNERKGMYVALILILQSVVFWVVWMQSVTSWTLFAANNMKLTLFGHEINPGITQSFAAFYLIVFSPILAQLYIYLYKKKINLSIPVKYSLGIILAGSPFLLLFMGIAFFADSNSQVSVLWLFFAYGLLAIVELLVSALGSSMVAKLLPKRLGGFAQGMWFLSLAVGMRLGGVVATYAGVNKSNLHDPAMILNTYKVLFFQLGLVTVMIGLVFGFFAKKLTRAMNQVLDHRS